MFSVLADRHALRISAPAQDTPHHDRATNLRISAVKATSSGATQPIIGTSLTRFGRIVALVKCRGVGSCAYPVQRW
jgi:hypothetical protein